MDFVKRQKAVAIAAIFDESRLQGRFDTGYFGEVNIAAQRRFGARLKVEFLDLIVLGHNHPCFFRVDCIDQHIFGHEYLPPLQRTGECCSGDGVCLGGTPQFAHARMAAANSASCSFFQYLVNDEARWVPS